MRSGLLLLLASAASASFLGASKSGKPFDFECKDGFSISGLSVSKDSKSGTIVIQAISNAFVSTSKTSSIITKTVTKDSFFADTLVKMDGEETCAEDQYVSGIKGIVAEGKHRLSCSCSTVNEDEAEFGECVAQERPFGSGGKGNWGIDPIGNLKGCPRNVLKTIQWTKDAVVLVFCELKVKGARYSNSCKQQQESRIKRSSKTTRITKSEISSSEVITITKESTITTVEESTVISEEAEQMEETYEEENGTDGDEEEGDDSEDGDDSEGGSEEGSEDDEEDSDDEDDEDSKECQGNKGKGKGKGKCKKSSKKGSKDKSKKKSKKGSKDKSKKGGKKGSEKSGSGSEDDAQSDDGSCSEEPCACVCVAACDPCEAESSAKRFKRSASGEFTKKSKSNGDIVISTNPKMKECDNCNCPDPADLCG
jgi:NACalpha-BTF3-like transcription factor